MVLTPTPSTLRDVLAAPPTPSIGTGNVDKVLEAVRTHLSMDVAFVSEFRSVDRRSGTGGIADTAGAVCD